MSVAVPVHDPTPQPIMESPPVSEAPTHRSRAAALPPEERRNAIVAATLPLVLAHGSAVTTRQIAEAAGIAEGTIFRVFADKEALISAVTDDALDPAPVDAALLAIELGLPLEERLAAAVDILRRRSSLVWQLMAAVGSERVSTILHRPTSPGAGKDKRYLDSLALLFEPDLGLLRRDAHACARLLRSVTLAGSHPALAGDEPLDSDEIISLLLDGLRAPSVPGELA